MRSDEKFAIDCLQQHLEPRTPKFLDNKIDQLLLDKWDPIGIRSTPEAQDEYTSYTAPILEIISNSCTPNQLAEYLWYIETEFMGLKGNRAETTKFAELLFKEIKQQL